MTIKCYAIEHSSDFLNNHVLPSLTADNALFSCVVSKNDVASLEDDTESDHRSKKSDAIQSAFRKEVQNQLLQNTLEVFYTYFETSFGPQTNDASTRSALTASVRFLLADNDLNELLASTDVFEALKADALQKTKEQLKKLESDYARNRASGGAVSKAQEKTFDETKKNLNDTISAGGVPVLFPQDYVDCYNTVLLKVVDTAGNILRWSRPITPKSKAKP